MIVCNVHLRKKHLQSYFFSYKMRDSYGGWVAQLVEQRIENPRVGGSIPSLATKDFSGFVLTQSQALMPASLIKQLAGIFYVHPELPDNRSRTRVIKVKDRMFC